MPRYVLDLPGDPLQWLLLQDAYPQMCPIFPEAEKDGLVCAQLIGGSVSAEVVTSAEHLVEVCGAGLPLGRLYFQIPKSALYRVCPALTPDTFGGERG